MDSYAVLPSLPSLAAGAKICRPDEDHLPTTLDSPALSVMTDLTRVHAAVIDPNASVDDAHHYMIQRGVRMLLALDRDDVLVGIITTNDLLGELPVTMTRERGLRHSEIRVSDVMTPASRLDAFDLKKVGSARVGNIVASLRESGRHHALVTQKDNAGRVEVRGIFSLTQIARQLGTPLPLSEAASSFAEIEAALLH
jgi:CBS domain-containing protein